MFSFAMMPEELVSILSSVVDIIPDLMKTQLQSVRQHVAGLMVLVFGYLHTHSVKLLTGQQRALVLKSQVIINI